MSYIVIDDSSDESDGVDVGAEAGIVADVCDLMNCPDGRVYYRTPEQGLDCTPLMEGFDAGYCCAPLSPDVPELGETTACGEQAYPSDVLLSGEPCFISGESYCCNKCPIHLRWDPHERAECVKTKNGPGFCCPYPEMVDAFDDGSRDEMAPLPIRTKQRLELNRHLKRDYFSENWKVVECSATGDCLYDCVARAINSAEAAEPPAMTVSLLRWSTARVINEGNVFAFRQDYMMNAPDDDTMNVYSTMDATTLQMYTMTPNHYATSIDIRMLYENEDLNIIPIVINGMYGSLLNSATFAETRSAITSYMANRSRYEGQQRQYRRFILLYQRQEHFRLIVRKDWFLSDSHKERFEMNPKVTAFRALFNADEIPAGILQQFEDLLFND